MESIRHPLLLQNPPQLVECDWWGLFELGQRLWLAFALSKLQILRLAFRLGQLWFLLTGGSWRVRFISVDRHDVAVSSRLSTLFWLFAAFPGIHRYGAWARSSHRIQPSTFGSHRPASRNSFASRGLAFSKNSTFFSLLRGTYCRWIQVALQQLQHFLSFFVFNKIIYISYKGGST